MHPIKKSNRCPEASQHRATTGPVEDPSLLARIQRRDQQALLALYERYSTRVYSVALRIVQNAPQAEEVLQDTYLRLWERSHLCQAHNGTVLPWLLTVSRNLALDRRRRESKRSETTVTFDDAILREDYSPDSGPDREQAVQQALATLPESQRTALELAFFEGLSHSELALRLGLPIGTIKTRIRLGLSKMKEVLGTWMLV